jgi:group I intron endonuclease
MIGIYKITNNVTKKSYVGQSGRLENRLSNHKKIAFDEKTKQYNDELYKDIRKYGIENFSFDILETISLDELEEKWIQKECKNNKVYNKNLFPHSKNQCQLKVFSEEQVLDIISLLKDNKLSNIKIAKKYNCSPATIDNINNGMTYLLKNETYPIREYKNEGELNHNALYTDVEVLKIRTEYKYHTLNELFNLYSKSSSKKSFERMVTGRSYNHIPKYIKRQDKWEN